MTHMDAYIMLTKDADYNCYIKAIELILTNHMGSISRHIMPLVINSLRGRHTHTQTNTHAYRHSRTEAILRNQVHAGRRPALAWFKNDVCMYVAMCL